MFPGFGLRVANLRCSCGRGAALGLGLEPFWSRASYMKVRATAKRSVLRLSLCDIAVAPRPTATGSLCLVYAGRRRVPTRVNVFRTLARCTFV